MLFTSAAFETSSKAKILKAALSNVHDVGQTRDVAKLEFRRLSRAGALPRDMHGLLTVYSFTPLAGAWSEIQNKRFKYNQI